MSPIGNGTELATTLNGSAQFNSQSAEKHLNDIKKANQKVKKQACLLAFILNRKQLTPVLGPNYISQSAQVITPAIPIPEGVMWMGPNLPVNKNSFDTMLVDMSQVLKQMRSNALAVNKWPAGLNTALASEWNQVTATMDDLVKRHNHLVELRATGKIQRHDLSKEIVAIYDDSERMQKPLQQTISTVKDYGSGTGVGLASRKAGPSM
jgi:hypothetical protein